MCIYIYIIRYWVSIATLPDGGYSHPSMIPVLVKSSFMCIYIINQQLLYVYISILLAKAPKLKRRVRGEEHVGAVITAACRDW